MNKLEVAELIEQIPDFLTPDEFLVALATKAAEVEREACAKVADAYADKIGPIEYDCGASIAAAIRARGER